MRGPMERMATRVTVRELEPEVADDLRSCEAKIEGALSDAWHALRKIHDEKLYKADKYKTFEDYCEKRWGYSKSRAYQLIDHAKLIDHLKSEGVEFLPAGEGLTRPLQKLRRVSKSEDEFLQKAEVAWRMATDHAEKIHDVPQVTVQAVESAMSHAGLYRNAKSKADTTAADCRNTLTKFAQSDARKMAPEDFVKKYEMKGFPSTFPRDLEWMIRCADLLGISGEA